MINTIIKENTELTGQRGGSLLNWFLKLGLKAKILGLLATLVTTAILSILFLEYQVYNGKTAIDDQREHLDELHLVQNALSTFADVKYWYTEVAVSLSEEAAISSEQSADLFVEQVNLIKSLDEGMRSKILEELDALKLDAEDALISYTFEEPEAGKAAMANVRNYISSIDSELVTLMNDARSKAENAVVVVERASNIALTGGAVMLLIVILVGLAMTVAMGAMILKPLVRITGEMKQLAQGNTDLKLIDSKNSDEVGDMARAVQVFCNNTLEIITLNKEQDIANKERQEEREAAELAEQNQRKQIEQQLESQKQQALAINMLLQGKVFETLETVVKSAEGMEQSSISLAQTVEKSSNEAELLSKASDQTENETNSVASATEELSASITAISQQIEDSTLISQNAVEMQQKANVAVLELDELSKHITDILKLIKDIAEKTNLLALNATIEAARAGEAGKGFAVVASEVKSLAQQTANATEDIQNQINLILSASAETVEAVDGIGKSIEAMNTSSQSISDAMLQQREATQEISSSVNQAAQGTGTITSGVGRIIEGISETDAASTQVHEVSEEILGVALNLKNEVDAFLKTVATDNGDDNYNNDNETIYSISAE